MGVKGKKKKVKRGKEIEISGVREEERDGRTRSVHGWGGLGLGCFSISSTSWTNWVMYLNNLTNDSNRFRYCIIGSLAWLVDGLSLMILSKESLETYKI